jgi:cytochrome c556
MSLLVGGSLYAHSGATGIVKERMDAMEAMGDLSKTVANMFKGKTEFDRDTLVDAADAFVQHGSDMTALFPDTPESRNGSNTQALPIIWNEWEDFTGMADEFVQKSIALQNFVGSTEDVTQLRKEFFKTTKGCLGCHKRYRKPKD